LAAKVIATCIYLPGDLTSGKAKSTMAYLFFSKVLEV